MANRHGGGNRQRTEWFGTGSSRVSMTADGIFLASGALVATTRETIRRIRGVIFYSLSGMLSANDRCIVASGIGIVSTDASVAGAASMPDPAVDIDYPWLWWRERTFWAPGVMTNATWDQGTLGAAGEVVEVDSKAMRIIRPGQSLVWIFQYVNGTGTPPVDVEVASHRILLGLS